MTTTTYKLGPGTLHLGAGPLDVSGQMSNVQVNPSESVKSGDALDLLDGTTLAADDEATYAFTLSGTLLQDISAAGVVAWSWDNKGTEQDFVFVPTSALERQVSGVLVPIPLQIGGDVKTRQVATFTWRIVGDPVFDDTP